jgi:hypothetical protein
MNWSYSIATAHNTAHAELANKKICVFPSTGIVRPDGRGKNEVSKLSFKSVTAKT